MLLLILLTVLAQVSELKNKFITTISIGVRIGFLRRAVTVEEGSNPVSICFSVKEGTLARNVNVNVSSSSNTAAIG